MTEEEAKALYMRLREILNDNNAIEHKVVNIQENTESRFISSFISIFVELLVMILGITLFDSFIIIVVMLLALGYTAGYTILKEIDDQNEISSLIDKMQVNVDLLKSITEKLSEYENSVDNVLEEDNTKESNLRINNVHIEGLAKIIDFKKAYNSSRIVSRKERQNIRTKRKNNIKR
jgi:hypothetical protein